MKNFKNLFAIMLAIISIVSMFMVGADAAGKADILGVDKDVRYFGDINMDGDITIADARLAMRASLKAYAFDKSDYEGAKKFYLADVNQSGTITPGDARIILRTAIGLEKVKVLPGRETVDVEAFYIDPDWHYGFYEHNKKNLNWCGFEETASYRSNPVLEDRANYVYTLKRATEENEFGYYYAFTAKLTDSKLLDILDRIYRDQKYPGEGTKTWTNTEREYVDRKLCAQMKKAGYSFDEGQNYHCYIFLPDGKPVWISIRDLDYVEPEDDYICDYCGKPDHFDDVCFACTAGGCCRYIADVTCVCGQKVKGNTCHTCPAGTPVM